MANIGDESRITVALIVSVTIIVILLVYLRLQPGDDTGSSAPQSCGTVVGVARDGGSPKIPQGGRPPNQPKGALSFDTGATPESLYESPTALALAEGEAAANQKEGVYKALSKMYTTDDVDPLIFGEGYQYRDNTRMIYDQRAAHGGVWGLQEFSSSGNDGDVGVDVGPEGLSEYEGRHTGYDDGIPENWNLPSTPVRWYKPLKRDYYGPEGIKPFSKGLYLTNTPDHQPPLGEDESAGY